MVCLAFSLTATAQNFDSGYMGPDTASASETVYLYPVGTSWATNRQDLKNLVALEVVVRTDSLSGATAGTATIEYCYDEDCTVVYTAATLTVNGPTAQYLRLQDTAFLARKFRVKLVNTSATQATKIQGVWSYKRL